MTTTLLRAEVDTAACQHGTDDGSREYMLLTLHVEIDGQPRMLRLRTSVGQYPGNDPMCEILHKVVERLNA